jgi:hypothetical protein
MARKATIKPNRSIYPLEELTKLHKREKNTRESRKFREPEH